MTTTLSTPIAFRLPDGWRAADPDKAGAPAAAFLAVRDIPDAELAATITISETDGPEGVPVGDVADRSLGRLVQLGRDVSLVRRTEYDTGAPAVSQLVTLIVTIDGTPRRMIQQHVFLMLGSRQVLQVVLTATPGQFELVIGEFSQFVGSIHLDG